MFVSKIDEYHQLQLFNVCMYYPILCAGAKYELKI